MADRDPPPVAPGASRSVPLGMVALGHRGRLRIVWHPDGDRHTSIPSLELARERRDERGTWLFVGSAIIRASCDLRELANAIDAAARFAQRWREEHPGEL